MYYETRKNAIHFCLQVEMIVDLRINEALQTGAVRNADHMNQRYEGSPCGIHRGEYAAKPHLPGVKVSIYF